MYVDSLKKAMAVHGPIFVQLYGQGEAHDDHRLLCLFDHLKRYAILVSGLRAIRSMSPLWTVAGRDQIGEIVCRAML
jgi:hypothetical protein